MKFRVRRVAVSLLFMMDSRAVSGMESSKTKAPKSHLCKMDVTYSYFSKKVDPVISPCVANFLFKQPQDIIVALRSYFDHIRKGLGTHTFDDIECYNPKKSQKVYFTYNFGPVISKIIDLVATSQPLDVVDFICNQLLRTEFLDLFSVLLNDNFEAEQDTKVKSTRNRLSDAITLANSIGNPSQEVKQGPKIAPGLVVVKPPTEISTAKARTNIQITLLGMGGGGKTSIINALEGKFDLNVKSSLGFKPTAMLLGENINVKFHDLGGGPKIRSIWVDYYHDVHAIMYIFDASLTDDILKESVTLFQSTMKHPSLFDKPVLIIANKQDKKGALSSAGLSQLLDLETISATRISLVECSSFVSKSRPVFPEDSGLKVPQTEPVMDHTDIGVDPRFESALELFLNNIQRDFNSLNNRVNSDIERRKAEDIKKRLERERKVLRNKIALAFKDDIEPALLPENLPKFNPEECFGEVDGALHKLLLERHLHLYNAAVIASCHLPTISLFFSFFSFYFFSIFVFSSGAAFLAGEIGSSAEELDQVRGTATEKLFEFIVTS